MSPGLLLVLAAVFVFLAFLCIAMSNAPRPFRRFYQMSILRNRARSVNEGKRLDEALKIRAFKVALGLFAIAFTLPIAALVLRKRAVDVEAYDLDPARRRMEDRILAEKQDLLRMEESMRRADMIRKSEGE